MTITTTTTTIPDSPTGVPVELVVLDMAGTTVVDDGLVEGAFARAWDRVMGGEGREAALEHVRATMGQSKIEVFRALADDARRSDLVAGNQRGPGPRGIEIIRLVA